MISAGGLADVLADVWPDEADAVGSQYLVLIARAALDGDARPQTIFLKSEGSHAYGLVEALETIATAATLIVSCIQLRQTTRTEAERRKALEDKISKELADEERTRRLVKRLMSDDR